MCNGLVSVLHTTLKNQNNENSFAFVMGKFKNKRGDAAKPGRNVPLAEQMLEEMSVRPPGREKRRRRREEDDDINVR